MFFLTYQQEAETSADKHVWLLKFTCLNSNDNTPAKVFVMHTHASGVTRDQFSCVASINQMLDLPADSSIAEGDDYVPFYRTHQFTLYSRSAKAAHEALQQIQEGVQWLAEDIYATRERAESRTILITPELPS